MDFPPFVMVYHKQTKSPCMLSQNTITALKAGDKNTLIGFGTFSATTRAARTGRNPQTGKEMKIAAKTNGKFTPGKALKDLAAKPVKVAKKAAKASAKKK
ncbi:MAG: HU family DNA-binding protein [Desulfuromonadales bacterium]|nr:HU family DNA-binding protein [Desulfuromonadales bacterium]